MTWTYEEALAENEGGVFGRLEESAQNGRLQRLKITVDNAFAKLVRAAEVALSDEAAARTLTRESLVQLREAELEAPGLVASCGADVGVLEELGREVGVRGFIRNQKSIREALADGSMSLDRFVEMDTEEVQAYNERVSLYAALGIDEDVVS